MAEKIAYFAGGCFWCVESDFEKFPGVKAGISGYMGGQIQNPTYKQVSKGVTGHYEVVKVIYDEIKVTYAQLAEELLRIIDPTDLKGSFCDRGQQYTSAIFYTDENEKKEAQDLVAKLEKSDYFQKPIAVKILKASTFYKAEDHHQDYYKKSGLHYKFYRFSSGRDDFIERNWRDKKSLLEDLNKNSK